MPTTDPTTVIPTTTIPTIVPLDEDDSISSDDDDDVSISGLQSADNAQSLMSNRNMDHNDGVAFFKMEDMDEHLKIRVDLSPKTYATLWGLLCCILCLGLCCCWKCSTLSR